MKKLIIPALALMFAMGSAHADTANAAFTVSVNFTPKCTATNATAPVISFGTYNAFDPAITNVALSAPLSIQCSRGLGATVTAAFDNSGAAEGLFSTGNLRYTLSAITKSAVSGGTAATASSVGTADTLTFSFTGTLPQQAGNNTTATLSASRNLVLTF